MKRLIIERIKALQKENQESNRFPINPNELEFKKDIQELLEKELNLLIKEGSVNVIGKTINKQRILSVV